MLLRDALGETLRDARTRQNRTLRDVSSAANVSLGYLSEVERGRKEASSELLASICDALDVELHDVLSSVSRTMQSGTTKHEAPGTVKNSASGQPGAGQIGQAGVRPLHPQLRIVVPYAGTQGGRGVAVS